MTRTRWMIRNGRERPKRFTRALQVEMLESRQLLASVVGGADKNDLQAAAAAQDVEATAITDDGYEPNDTYRAAKDLGTLTYAKTYSNLVSAGNDDWFRFTTTKTGTASDTVAIAFPNAQDYPDLALYSGDVNSPQLLSASRGRGSTSEQVSLDGLPAGTYYLVVLGNIFDPATTYSLTITPPRRFDDSYEQNDTFATAYNLGTLTTTKQISNLIMADGHDWFAFTTTTIGRSTDKIAISSTSTQGNLDLQLHNSSGTLLRSSSVSTTNTEEISLSGRAAGSYRVHVKGTANPDYKLVITLGPPFDIRFTFSGLSATVQGVFEKAAQRWESIIVGDLPNAMYNGVAVDDLLIEANGASIDGASGVLAQANWDKLRDTGSQLPVHGHVVVDYADLASLQADGRLQRVIEHEIGHVLGIGTLWESTGLLTGKGTSNPRYTGAGGSAEWRALSGSSSGVPVENVGATGSRDSHWRESVFDEELMTSRVESAGRRMPISRMTIASLRDLGYTVNLAAADPYSLPANLSSLADSSTWSGFSDGAKFVASQSADSGLLEIQIVEPQFSSRGFSVNGAHDEPIAASYSTGARGQSILLNPPTGSFIQTPSKDGVDALLSDWKSFARHLKGENVLI